MKKTAVTVFLSAFLAACAQPLEGYGDGQVHGPRGEALGRVALNYTSDGTGSGDVRAVMPDGEVFEGTWVVVGARQRWGSGRSVSSPLSGIRDITSALAEGFAKDPRVREAYKLERLHREALAGETVIDTGLREAVLLSNRGNSMRCIIRWSGVHGVGTCRISDGRSVAVQF